MTECARRTQRRTRRPSATLTSSVAGVQQVRCFSVVVAEHRWSSAVVFQAVVSAEALSSSWLYWLEVGLSENK